MYPTDRDRPGTTGVTRCVAVRTACQGVSTVTTGKMCVDLLTKDVQNRQRSTHIVGPGGHFFKRQNSDRADSEYSSQYVTTVC